LLLCPGGNGIRGIIPSNPQGRLLRPTLSTVCLLCFVTSVDTLM
jgi:hypothetical protein